MKLNFAPLDAALERLSAKAGELESLDRSEAEIRAEVEACSARIKTVAASALAPADGKDAPPETPNRDLNAITFANTKLALIPGMRTRIEGELKALETEMHEQRVAVLQQLVEEAKRRLAEQMAAHRKMLDAECVEPLIVSRIVDEFEAASKWTHAINQCHYLINSQFFGATQAVRVAKAVAAQIQQGNAVDINAAIAA